MLIDAFSRRMASYEPTRKGGVLGVLQCDGSHMIMEGEF
jgi:hypothetical protein